MSDKPSYLGLLNAIANAEARANTYLEAWCETTPSEDVRNVLRTVAAREGEHGMSFAKRIDELGYHVRVKDDPGFEKAMALVTSDRSDLEKMEALKLHELDTGDKPDLFDRFFADHSIDVQTGELLGRYIAEERDTARLLRSCWQQLKASSNGNGKSKRDAAPTDELAGLEHKVDALSRSVDELREIVCAPAKPAARKKTPARSRRG